MDLPEKFRPSTVLGQVADHIQAHYSDLQVVFSSHHVMYRGYPIRNVRLPPWSRCPDLPPTQPGEKPYEPQALENIPFLKEATPFSSSRLIRTTGKPGATDFPKPLFPERRTLFKKKAFDGNNSHSEILKMKSPSAPI